MKYYFFIITLFLTQLAIAQEQSTSTDSNIWSFEDCVKYALENNITVKEAALNTEIAEVDYYKSKSARLPNLFGSASQSFSNGNSIDPITSDYVTDQIHSTNVGINSSVTLFQGNQLNNQVSQNKLLLEQSIFQQEVEKNNIELALLEAYLQALYSKESITIAENNLRASENELERAKIRLDAETITLSDYTEVQSQTATNRYEVITAKNTYQQYIIELKQLLELPPIATIEIAPVAEVAAINPMDRLEIYQTALNIMPEIEVSKLGIASSEKDLAIAKGAYLPTLSLSGSLGSGYTSIDNNSFADQFDFNFNQQVGLTLSIPIFNRNQTKAAVQTASINMDKARISKQSTEKALYKQVELAYQNALSAQEQLRAAETSQESAEQAYELAQQKYDLGSMSTTDLVISQNTYMNTQQNYLQAKYLSILYGQLLEFYQGNDLKL